ncbi:MAG: hypothetical protein P8Y97_05605 [Candidatus Lokiarchaeota archaeon]
MIEIEKILQYLIKYCSFLYAPNKFRFVNSMSSESFGNAFLILEHENLRLRFIKDRDQLFLDFQSTTKNRKNEWFSIDIVKQLITDKIEPSSEMDSEKAEFLRTNLDEIQRLFSPTNIENTFKKLKELERERMK